MVSLESTLNRVHTFLWCFYCCWIYCWVWPVAWKKGIVSLANSWWNFILFLIMIIVIQVGLWKEFWYIYFQKTQSMIAKNFEVHQIVQTEKPLTAAAKWCYEIQLLWKFGSQRCIQNPVEHLKWSFFAK